MKIFKKHTFCYGWRQQRGETKKNVRSLKVLNRMENKAKEFGKQFILVNNTKDMRV